MNRPSSLFHQAQGKAYAALQRGCGWFPLQDQPCDLEPPSEYPQPHVLDQWECLVNNWSGPVQTG